MKSFRQFIVPESVEEAISLRRSIGPKALYIAGGTTVVPFASRGVEVLIDISRLGLEGISARNGSVSIGATTRLSALLSPEIRSGFPSLYQAARWCATPAIRNMATLGGSLAGIYLPSDIGVALLALGAGLNLEGETSRAVAMQELLSDGWLSGYHLITEITVSMPAKNTGTCFMKFGRSGIDVALVNVATAVTLSDGRRIEDLRICVGQTSARPVLLEDASSSAVSRDLSLELIEELARSAAGSIEARSDSRASSGYRRHLVRVLVGRSLTRAAGEVGVGFES